MSKFYFLLIIVCSCVTSHPISSLTRDELLQQIVESQPIVSYSVKEIPKYLKKEYQRKFTISLNLSNPGNSYNASDVVLANEPIGMLLFSGTAHNTSVGFILFESKGIASQCYFLCYKYKHKKMVQLESFILKKKPVNFEELRQIIIEKKYF